MAGRTGAFLRGSNQGLGRLAQALAMGGQSEEQAFQSGVAGQSKVMQALMAAQRDRAAAEADDTKTAVLSGRPGLYDEQVALRSGQSVPVVRGYREFVRTGKMPQIELPGPATPEGGALMADLVPQEARSRIATELQRLVPMLSDSGDIGMKGLADAMGAYQQQDRAAAVRGGGLDLPTVGQQEAALKGDRLVDVDEFGVTNIFTGKQDTTGPAAQRFGAYRDSTTKAQNANAAQSYAAADSSKATAAKTRQEAEEGAGNARLPVAHEWGPNDPATGRRTVRPIIGGPADPNTKGAKLQRPPTEGQSKAIGFGSRMAVADEILNELAAEGVKRPGNIKSIAEGVGSAIGLGTDSMGGMLADMAGSATNFTQSEKQQQVDQAQRDFINAVLRRESGAAIGQGEFRNAAKQYFPSVGDDKATLKQKAANRRTAINAMKAEFGEAYLPDFTRSVEEARASRGRSNKGVTGSWDTTGATPGADPRTVTVDW